MGLISVLFSQNNIVLKTKGIAQDSLKYGMAVNALQNIKYLPRRNASKLSKYPVHRFISRFISKKRKKAPNASLHSVPCRLIILSSVYALTVMWGTGYFPAPPWGMGSGTAAASLSGTQVPVPQ